MIFFIKYITFSVVGAQQSDAIMFHTTLNTGSKIKENLNPTKMIPRLFYSSNRLRDGF